MTFTSMVALEIVATKPYPVKSRQVDPLVESRFGRTRLLLIEGFTAPRVWQPRDIDNRCSTCGLLHLRLAGDDRAHDLKVSQAILPTSKHYHT